MQQSNVKLEKARYYVRLCKDLEFINLDMLIVARKAQRCKRFKTPTARFN